VYQLWLAGGPDAKQTAWGDRPNAKQEAAKQCTNYGWPVGPTLNKMDHICP
jgi:hypothetical protein